MQGNKHAYFGAVFLNDDQEILAYTFNGAMHHWRKQSGKWQPALTLKGHFGEVTDLDWEGDSVLTCSSDQTTRLFTETEKFGWFEVARP